MRLRVWGVAIFIVSLNLTLADFIPVLLEGEVIGTWSLKAALRRVGRESMSSILWERRDSYGSGS